MPAPEIPQTLHSSELLLKIPDGLGSAKKTIRALNIDQAAEEITCTFNVVCILYYRSSRFVLILS
jgi:hypothetical protein